ncbi:transposase [Xanthobacter oligotrophicus]|uniref:Transposase n=1 Tax=Xanthobacter oligotrophicus TaxID=2607286 RepID=A0ABW7A1X2_9HYPH
MLGQRGDRQVAEQTIRMSRTTSADVHVTAHVRARLATDSAYGSAENLAWLVHERGIEPHITLIDKSEREDGTFSRSDFTYDHMHDRYTCPARKELRQYRRRFGVTRGGVDPQGLMRYRASKFDCDACTLKPSYCPNAPARKILRLIHEGDRDMARDITATEAYLTSRLQQKKVEMLFAHLKCILRLDWLRLRGLNGARDEFNLAAAARNLRKLAKLGPDGSRVAIKPQEPFAVPEPS